MPVSQAYTSVSFYARSGVAYYAINDRAAGRRIIELDLMTTQQRAELPDDEEITAADRLIVESPTPTGLILIRTFGPEPGLMPMARRALASAQCRTPILIYFVTIGARRYRLKFNACAARKRRIGLRDDRLEARQRTLRLDGKD